MTEHLKGLSDFHCHLDLFPDIETAIAQRERDAVFTLAVTTTPKAFPRNKELAECTQYVRAAVGLHPQLVDKRSHEIDLFAELLPNTRYVGEIGLDAGPQFYRFFEKQKSVFDQILQLCAHAGDKILSIHSVRTAKIVLDMIEARLPRTRRKFVLHWFTGSASDARRAVECGAFFSVNTAMLSSERGRKLIVALPRDRLLTETDAPFIRGDDGNSSVPATYVVRNELAALYGVHRDEISAQISFNLGELLS